MDNLNCISLINKGVVTMLKNVLVFSKNSNYKNLFESHAEIETALLTNKIIKPTIDISAVLLDGAIMEVENFAEIREAFPEQKIYYKPTGIHSDVIMRNITRLCATHRINMVNEFLTESQVVEEIVNIITNKSEYMSKRVISFFGTHSGAGVSTTTLNVANSLAQRTEAKVLVLSLNVWDPSDYFYEYQGHHLNDLKVDLRTQSLTPARLEESLSQHSSGFYHLAGNRDIKMQRYFHPEEVEHLITVAKESFDLVLIDSGTHFDSGTTAQAYMSSNLRFLVTTQEEKGYRGYFPHVFQQLIEPIGGKTSDFMLLINKYQNRNTIIDSKKLEEELNMAMVATIPDMNDLGNMSTYQKKLLYDLASDSVYTKNIDLVSNLIISETKLTEKIKDNDRKEKKGFMKLFS